MSELQAQQAGNQGLAHSGAVDGVISRPCQCSGPAGTLGGQGLHVVVCGVFGVHGGLDFGDQESPERVQGHGGEATFVGAQHVGGVGGADVDAVHGACFLI